MEMNDQPILYSRRDFGKLALAGLPLSLAFVNIDSRIKGVQIGAQSYSFRSIANAEDIIKAMVKIGLGEIELMSNHAEALAGAPSPGPPAGGRGTGSASSAPAPTAPNAPAPTAGQGGPPASPPPNPERAGRGRGRGQMTPEQQAAAQARAEELRKWRASVSMDKFKAVRKKFDDAGIDLRLLCFNMNRNTTDDEIEYAFQMAKALGAKAISSSTQVSVAKRVAPFADKHQIMVGYHGHSNLTDPDEFATPESFATAMSFSNYHGVNLDIGHFTAANFDAVPYIEKNHERITNLHLKDRKRNQGENVPWGQGDTPIKPVLQLLSKNKWDIPANIEFEYGGDPIVEVAKCFEYCKQALA